MVTHIPEVYTHPKDAKDSPYINLDLVTKSDLVISRDRHLLDLMETGTAESRAFQQQYPELKVLRPVEFLRWLKARAD